MVSGGLMQMSNKEQNNEMLSFEDLKKQLGMPVSDNDIKTATDNQITRKPSVSKFIEDNNDSFVDITAQYVSTEEEVTDEVVKEEKEIAKVPEKKRIRTFNFVDNVIRNIQKIFLALKTKFDH